jgi:hypothetical protein
MSNGGEGCFEGALGVRVSNSLTRLLQYGEKAVPMEFNSHLLIIGKAAARLSHDVRASSVQDSATASNVGMRTL